MPETITRSSRSQACGTRSQRAAAIFFTLFLLSHNFTIAAETVDATLEVKPKVCVSQVGEACEMELEVAWMAKTATDLCLRLRDSGEVLECWRQAREGRYSMPYSSEANVGLQLVSESLRVLDEVEIKVVSRDLRDSRRRRRHVWSIL